MFDEFFFVAACTSDDFQKVGLPWYDKWEWNEKEFVAAVFVWDKGKDKIFWSGVGYIQGVYESVRVYSHDGATFKEFGIYV